MRAVIDLDYVKYSAASVGETRQIRAVHRDSGREKVFKNRTEFWGHWKKKNGGYLATLNKDRTSPFLPEDFDILDEQIAEPIENCLHTAKSMVEGALERSGAFDHVAFLGKGESFRVGRSTILEYKGNRKDTLRPIHLDDVSEYLAKKFDAIIVEGIEADDACVMAAYQDPNSFIICSDKDYYGSDVCVFNINHEEEGIVDCSGFGKLWLNEKGDVRGTGLLFLLWQVASGDSSDNYAANSACYARWGDKSAFKALAECRSEAEAYEAVVRVYKKLYPSKNSVTGWRGDTLEVDWKYVLSENYDLARMLRWEGDNLTIEDVLKDWGLWDE